MLWTHHCVLTEIVQGRFVLYLLNRQNTRYISQGQKTLWLLALKQIMQKLHIPMYQILSIRMIPDHTVPLINDDDKLYTRGYIRLAQHICYICRKMHIRQRFLQLHTNGWRNIIYQIFLMITCKGRHIQMNHIVLIQTLIPIFGLPDVQASKKLPGVAASAIKCLQHPRSLRLAKTPGMTEGNTVLLCTNNTICVFNEPRFIHIYFTLRWNSKSFIARIKIYPHHAHRPINIYSINLQL